MEDKLGKILSILLYVLITISVVLGGYYVFIADITPETTMFHMYWAYALAIVGALLAIVAPIIYMILNPARAKSVLIAVIAFVALGGIAYVLASNGIEGAVYEKFEVTEVASKRIGTGLIATYILGGLAVAVTLFSGISKVFK